MQTIVSTRGYSKTQQDREKLPSHTNTGLHSCRDNYVHGIRKVIYLFLAGVFLTLGIVGIILPGLPTTPFVLLSSYFLTRSSPRMHRALLANQVFGPILRQWQEQRAVEMRVKKRAVIFIVASIALLV